MWSYLCLSILLCFVDTVTAQNMDATPLIAILVVVPVIFLIVYGSVMIISIILNAYKIFKSDKNAKFAANPNVKDKDLEQSIIVGNPNVEPVQQSDTHIPAFGTADTIVHREEHMSPIQ